MTSLFSITVIAAGSNITNQATIIPSSEYSEDYSGEKCVHEEEAEHEAGTDWASAGELTPWIKFDFLNTILY
jgi:hypothetical protein